LRRGTREGVTASGTPLAHHEIGLAQAPEDLLEVARGDRLALAHDPDLDRLALPLEGEGEDAADRLLNLEREAPRNQPCTTSPIRRGAAARRHVRRGVILARA